MALWRRWMLGGALAAIVLAAAGVAHAQRFFREGSYAPRYAPSEMPDANFVVCRLAYRQVRSEPSGIGWMTDYPYAEINLTTRFSELTKTRVSRDSTRTPNFYVVRPLDDALFNCPFVVASDAGTIGFREDEAEHMRNYLLKGGFFWADDFWGSAAWDHWASQIARVFPPADYPIEDVQIGDPMLRSLFEVKEIPQITNIQFWRRFGGTQTSERGEDSAEVHFRAIRDSHRRIMVLMTHNTDVADSWEREGEDPAFFYQFSPSGYALGIDVLLHAMTH
ncbi:MAG TPA: DUF4159 domain-containing protein [Vicinamibacterales bacterium]|jgi:hypothetical protein|nr:DUF4159 domain-containing protein [Vicinamibacterales bacterium]